MYNKSLFKRQGLPAKGQLDISLETNTDLDVNVDVQVQVTQNISAQMPEGLDESKVRQPEGKVFEYTEFDSFFLFFDQHRFTHVPERYRLYTKADLWIYWNQWYGANLNRASFIPRRYDVSYIDRLFISVDFLQHMEQFQDGLSLAHLPIGLKAIRSKRTNAFDVIFSPPQRGQQLDDYAIPFYPTSAEVSPEIKQETLIQFKNSLSPAEQFWWLRLLAQHQKHVSQDDELGLSRVFDTFRQEIKRRELHFDETQMTEESFQHSKNLRTTLANILAVLDQVALKGKNDHRRQENDVRTVWQNVPHLAWQSNGAVRGIYSPPQYTVILPEMGIDPSYDDEVDSNVKYAFNRYTATINKGSQVDDNLDKLSTEEFNRHFFRMVAAEQHRYPMAFYIEALKKVNQVSLFKHDDKKSQHIRRALMEMLRRSTTGTALFCQDHPRIAMERWERLLTLFADFPLPETPFQSQDQPSTNLLSRAASMLMGVANKAVNVVAHTIAVSIGVKEEISSEVITLFYGLNSSPSLETLDRLSQILAHDVRSLPKEELRKLEPTLRTNFENLDRLVEYFWGKGIYDGMRFLGRVLNLKPLIEQICRFVNSFCSSLHQSFILI